MQATGPGQGSGTVTDFARGRPLDDGETRALQQIEGHLRDEDPDLAERLGSGRARGLAPARLRLRRVAWVLAVTLVYVVLLSRLPADAAFAVVLVTLVLVLLVVCLCWATLSGKL